MANIIGLNLKKDKNKERLSSYFDNKNMAFRFEIEGKLREVKEFEEIIKNTDTLNFEYERLKRLENLSKYKSKLSMTFFYLQSETWRNLKKVNLGELDLQSEISAYHNNLIQFIDIVSDCYRHTSIEDSNIDSLTLSNDLQLESEFYLSRNDSIINHIKKQIADD